MTSETPPASAPRQTTRTGKVARLPKEERDMVNTMLQDGVPYARIVSALKELGYTVSPRNISNWKTGGYLEWTRQQEFALQHRLHQDDLLDLLRSEDASQLPEVALQLFATLLCESFLEPNASQRLADAPESFSRLASVLCRLTRVLFMLQKDRDETARAIDPDENPQAMKKETLTLIDQILRDLAPKPTPKPPPPHQSTNPPIHESINP